MVPWLVASGTRALLYTTAFSPVVSKTPRTYLPSTFLCGHFCFTLRGAPPPTSSSCWPVYIASPDIPSITKKGLCRPPLGLSTTIDLPHRTLSKLAPLRSDTGLFRYSLPYGTQMPQTKKFTPDCPTLRARPSSKRLPLPCCARQR
ncbi:hypothetical protein GY45DRAFT_98333 [Cubamyces sp. BRFM 1775]|nr:hypothetical protein GY45DRAFT_98333 [Cubamyces sp. BRFM 1775]